MYEISGIAATVVSWVANNFWLTVGLLLAACIVLAGIITN